ncbi:uncharacterized protein [Oryza sativa Japonica Group]|uniref:uncharacterized protein isoform X3 n=1 Tax=Oryza sativa subsp. japonica TaxID=39947 RepID=UPI00339CA8B4
MPNKFPFDTISFHPLQRRERHRAHGSFRARPERRRHDLVAVPAAVERIRPSRRAKIFPSRSSPNALKNPQDPSTEERYRAILLQLRPPSSIFDSSFSVSQADAVHGEGAPSPSRSERRRRRPSLANLVQYYCNIWQMGQPPAGQQAADAELDNAWSQDHPMGQVMEVNPDGMLALVPAIPDVSAPVPTAVSLVRKDKVQVSVQDPKVQEFLAKLGKIARSENPAHPFFYPMSGLNDKIDLLRKEKGTMHQFLASSSVPAAIHATNPFTTLVLPKTTMFDFAPLVGQEMSQPDFRFRIYKLFNKLLLEFILNVH